VKDDVDEVKVVEKKKTLEEYLLLHEDGMEIKKINNLSLSCNNKNKSPVKKPSSFGSFNVIPNSSSNNIKSRASAPSISPTKFRQRENSNNNKKK
jgi:hypothetical protein